MRDVKFRAWNKIEKRFFHFTLFSPLDVNSNFWEKSEVMQYTGLKDKNGKEIYEGDILEKGKDLFKIYWCENFMGFRLWELTTNRPVPLSTEIVHPSFCTIIGNIHNNPELLK